MKLKITFIFINTVNASVGYDCARSSLNISTFSILKVAECEIPDLQPRNDSIYIQLLQASDYDTARIQQCKIDIDRTIYHCGMYSQVSVVHNGRREYLHPLTQQLRQQVHATGCLLLEHNTLISELRKNSSDTRSFTLSCSITTDVTCKGAQYSDPYGTWDDVVVQATVKITMRGYYVQTRSNQIHLKSGTFCVLNG